VLVVGGGIAGAATARELALAGADVILAEQGELGGAGSAANAGSLHAQIQHAPFLERGDRWARAYAPATRFLLQSIEIWRTLSDELGEDLEVSLGGGLLVAADPTELPAIERKVEIEREQGLTSELLSGDDLRTLAPYLADDLVGGELCPDEGKANPLLATAALARAASRAGARIMARTAVLAIDRNGSGFTARTQTGAIACRRIVSCGGVAAGAITAMLGAPVEVWGDPIQASVTEAVAPLIGHLIYFAGAPLTLKQARAGSILIGGGWPAALRDGSPVVDRESLLANLGVAARVAPAVRGVRLLRTWAGFVNATRSWLPVIGELPVAPGAFVGAFPYMGFTAGPLLGRALAELATGRPPSAQISGFSP
jgi:sarcosine oxidase, subunit beta